VSDIHFDLRPEFEAAGLGDLIDAFVFSFEHGVQKPPAEFFRIAADSLALLRTADVPRNLRVVLGLLDPAHALREFGPS